MKITQYFMLDLDQDGQKEVIANNDKNLVVFGAKMVWENYFTTSQCLSGYISVERIVRCNS